MSDLAIMSARSRPRAQPPASSAALQVIIRRERGWPDGSESLAALANELNGASANVHLCLGDEDPPPRSSLEVRIHRRRSSYQTSGATLNNALAEETTSNVLILNSTDVLMRHGLIRLLGAFRDRGYDVCYGMVIDWSGDLTSALPVEHSRLARHDYLAAASLWRRSAIEALGGWSEVLRSDSELSWDLWKRLSRSDLRTYFVARPLVRQRFVQKPATAVKSDGSKMHEMRPR